MMYRLIATGIRIILILFGLSTIANGQAFITTWKTDNPGSSGTTEITIPTTGAGYNYNVYWEEIGDATHFGNLTGITGNVTIDFSSIGDYRVEITGAFPHIFFNGGGDRRKILSVEQWGSISWTSMAAAFRGCSNLVINALDAPDLSNVTDMSSMFRSATSLNNDISGWDVSNVTDMNSLFSGADVFNQSLNTWDVGAVTDMTSMFQNASDFNGNISAWDVSNVTSMRLMFRVASDFNQDISAWSVGNVADMHQMFDFDTDFNQPIGSWDVSSVTTMERMFGAASTFNQNINAWDVSSVTNMYQMFNGATDFNQPIDGWDVSNVTNMRSMFADANSFNQDLNSWDVSSVTTMRSMFYSANSFNGAIGSWDVSNVTTMHSMFRSAPFDQPIGAWDVSSVTNMQEMFAFTPFNQDISGWDMSSVTNIERMFNWAQQFNQDLSTWDVSNITTMRATFSYSVFNMPIGSWDVSKVTDMIDMFQGTPFNQDIGGWDVSNVGFMASMFYNASDFNQDLSAWDVTGVINLSSMFGGTAFDYSLASWDISNAISMSFMFDNSGISVDNYDQTIIAWAALPGPLLSGVTFGGTSVFYCTSGPARATLSANYGWVFNDGGQQCPAGEIAVFEGANNTGTELSDGQANASDFGIGIQGTDIVEQFTIENQGTNNIVVSNITLSGTAFSLLSPTSYTIAPGNSETIDVQLSGGTVGVFTETLTIINDDADEASFDFPVTGDIRATAEPEIVVYEGSSVSGTPIIDGQATAYNLGSGYVDVGLTNQITIENIGTAALNISTITVSGSSFSVLSATTASVNTGNTVTIDIMLSGSTINTFTETLTISSDDVDEPNFSFTITGDLTAAPEPEIAVFQNSTEIFDGQLAAVDFGVTNLGTDITLQFSIANSGSADLLISNISITGTAFTITSTIPTVSLLDGISPTFDVTLSGVTGGTFNETITIENDDADESTFDFPITGTINCFSITAGSPSIQSNVGQPTVVDVITSSNTTPSNISTVTITQNPSQGIASVSTDNTISYTPNVGTIGADAFDYEICNQCGLCSNATVAIDILNEAPVITPPSVTVTSLAGKSVIIPFQSFISDPNNNIDLNSIQIIANPLSNAPASLDTDFNLIIDYSNTPFGGTDRITIQVCDQLGACSQIELEIEINGEIIAHNGISPNSDGLNDYFEIQNIEFLEPVNNVTIYNRWGDKVFEMANYNSDLSERRFEGRQNNGKELPSGVYFYRVNFQSGRASLNGYLTLKK